MEHLMLVSLSLGSMLSFFAYCILLSVLNFIAFIIDYGALLHLVHRHPLSTLPRFMWSARMGYSAPFTLSLTELTLVGYLTLYTVTGTVFVTDTPVYSRPSLWRVYFWVFLFQRISRLATLLRSPLLSLPVPELNTNRLGHSNQTKSITESKSTHKYSRLNLVLTLTCFSAWFYLACVLRWMELIHHLLVAHSFLICLYTSRLVQWTTWLMTSCTLSDTVSEFTSQLDCTALCLHLIPACLLPYFWSPQSGPARFQWVVELFLFLLVHLYDHYRYDDVWTKTKPSSCMSFGSGPNAIVFCALCLRRRHRPFTSFASPDTPEPDTLPCRHVVHRACYRIWQAIAPECTECKLLAAYGKHL
ncbi:unnamed protein product [Echinostoma caproni]|uniref:RING-type domain-containing protein n=1 Tax=Echinostoma caproni TaxID=27848 RepID=A0A183AE36_9TREM|nr:unnamed protein product [Echinostoma caproni]